MRSLDLTSSLSGNLCVIVWRDLPVVDWYCIEWLVGLFSLEMPEHTSSDMIDTAYSRNFLI